MNGYNGTMLNNFEKRMFKKWTAHRPHMDNKHADAIVQSLWEYCFIMMYRSPAPRIYSARNRNVRLGNSFDKSTNRNVSKTTAYPPKEWREEPAISRRLWWTEIFPAAVSAIVEQLEANGTATHENVSRIIAEVTPAFRLLDPSIKGTNLALFKAYEVDYRAAALDALKRATMPPAEVSETDAPPEPVNKAESLADRWNGKTVGRLRVVEWGMSVAWKRNRKKEDCKTPEWETFSFTNPRIWAGVALILDNGGDFADMTQANKGYKSKWKNCFQTEEEKRFRDAALEPKPQDEPGKTKGQYWRLKSLQPESRTR